MAKKAYVSNRFPGLTMGTTVQFVDGVFETEDAEAQALVEKSDWYGIHIHDRDPAPPAEAPAAEAAPVESEPSAEAAAESESPRVRHGSRGSRS